MLLDAPTGGARIQIDIPAGPQTDLSGESDATAEVGLSTNCRILVVDDESSVLRAIRRLLAPHTVICATGTEALQILEDDDDFDAIICDVMMPDVDGVTIFESLEARSAALAHRMIFHTGGAVSVRGSALLARIGNPVLEKPATRNEFVRALVSVISETTQEERTKSSARLLTPS